MHDFEISFFQKRVRLTYNVRFSHHFASFAYCCFDKVVMLGFAYSYSFIGKDFTCKLDHMKDL